MKKPWSITTTVRDPNRLRPFLIVFQQLDGCEWNKENQKKYQILLIKERVYGYGNPQFYTTLSKKQITLIDNQLGTISFKQAKEIFDAKKYTDPPMRGRQSLNPLTKFGLVIIKNKKALITDLGKLLLRENSDIGEIIFRSFLKWQIPNPDSSDYKIEDGYDIKPFIGVLHLINKVNEKSLALREKPKGISKKEFSLFCPTLINYNDIDCFAEKIILLRKQLKGRNKQEQKDIFNEYQYNFAMEFLETDKSEEIEKFLNTLKDYGDNTIRYFRLTRFLYIRGRIYYIDLEPRRSIEIENLLGYDNSKSKKFKSKEEYLDYISNNFEPVLPWETTEKYKEIISEILEDIKIYQDRLRDIPKKILNYNNFINEDLRRYIIELRQYRRELQEKENYNKSQDITQINIYIKRFENIFNSDNKPILLEELSTFGLNAINDALRIKPNYPVGDDNRPTYTAPANIPDIECFYEKYNAICEVTMLTNREQWYNEGQPVMRHLRDFENKYNNKNSYCLFIAPKFHRDTINTFWISVKHEYEGEKQRIVPLSINDFINILKIVIKLKKSGRKLTHLHLVNLYDKIIGLAESLNNSNDWLNSIPETIEKWEKFLDTTI